MSASKVAKTPKKLVQPCLTFKLINSPGDDGNSICRKRKFSSTEDDDLRVENPKIELLNGGNKCFIKSEDKNNSPSTEIREIIIDDVNNRKSTKESVTLVTSLENCIDTSTNEISDVNTTKIDENVIVIDDNDSMNIDSDPQNSSINSTLDSGQIEHVTPTSIDTKHKGKRQESAKKQEERQKLKQEKEKAREEKFEKQRLKQLEKEQKKNADLETKRLRELEKEREKKQKEEDKKQKEEERKQKEEEKKQKELEKEKEIEKKLLSDEIEKKKKEKVKAAFVRFFKPKRLIIDNLKKEEELIYEDRKTYFMPFQTKQDMKIAPSCRIYLDNDKKKYIDTCVTQCEENKDLLYLNLLKTGKYKPSKSEATWSVNVDDDAVDIIVETGSINDVDETVNKVGTRLKQCWKLLQFKENRRPPYWGTWRKKSLYIKPRKPFACDKIMFDYEIDSDDEWEEEDPGESIHGTDDEIEPEDDYEVDNDIFVPHGYLSDEEGDQDSDNSSKETQKEKLKLLGEEFEAEIKKKTQRIKPRIVGCIWIPNNVTNPENVSKSAADTLLKYRCIWDNEMPIITNTPSIVDSPNDISASESKGTSSESKGTALLPDSIITDLITFVHGKTNLNLIAKDFFNELVKNGCNIVDDSSITLAMIKKTIRTIATKSTHTAPWFVTKENFEKYGIEYPKNVETEVPKLTKPTVKKITSFMRPQSQKDLISVEKTCTEVEQNKNKNELIPRSLFIDKERNSNSSVIEQKIKIIDGKKRITPILISPKKKPNLIIENKPRERSWSPKIKTACQGTSVPNDTDIEI